MFCSPPSRSVVLLTTNPPVPLARPNKTSWLADPEFERGAPRSSESPSGPRLSPPRRKPPGGGIGLNDNRPHIDGVERDAGFIRSVDGFPNFRFRIGRKRSREHNHDFP